jgi:hypothetical protein
MRNLSSESTFSAIILPHGDCISKWGWAAFEREGTKFRYGTGVGVFFVPVILISFFFWWEFSRFTYSE